MIASQPAIDVHGHFGRYDRGLGKLQNEFMSASAEVVAERARRANIRWTIVSPLEALLPRGQADVVAGNRNAVDVIARTPGLRQHVVIDPRVPETFRQADEMLRLPSCVGIKIHPEEHVYSVKEHGRAVFEFAAARRAVILSHSSERLSLAADLVEFANEFPEARLILAHIGCGWDDDQGHQVGAVQKSRHGNVYADTSSAQSITPNLIEWAVRELGANRVLFGTDTPLYHAAMQRARIDHADLPDADKRRILYANAAELFGLEC
jgi:predicted TIM-barrel fold metal-dependent hydrolase